MTTDSIEIRVIKFIASRAEVKRERVSPASRLLDDLGIDGDDAVELFDGIHEHFGTDLTRLYESWSEYFGPEGMPLSVAIIIIPAAISAGLAFSLTNVMLGTVAGAIAAVVSAAIFVAASILIGRKLGVIKEVTPITVAEVVRSRRTRFLASQGAISSVRGEVDLGGDSA